MALKIQKKLKIHIVNYLGDDSQANKTGTTIKQSRTRVLDLLLIDLLTYWDNCEIIVWNQQPYTPPVELSIHLLNNKLQFRTTHHQSVSQARNEILSEFYNTNDDWCAIIDNDIGVYHDDKDRLDTNTFINNPMKILNQITGQVAAFSLFSPNVSPYSLLKNRQGWLPILKDNWQFTNTLNLNALVFHSNYPKLFDIKELYYDENIDVLEDVDFACQLWTNDLFVGKLQNVFMREYSNKSSIFKTEPTFTPYKNRGPRAQEGKWDWDDRQDRNIRYSDSKEYLKDKWGIDYNKLHRSKSDILVAKPNSHFNELFDAT
jgi:hypothetical protein